MSFFRALNARVFAVYLAGQFISGLGDSISGIAIAWWVADQVRSAEVMGQILAVAFLPRLILLLLGGVIGDRLPRLKVLLVISMVQGLTSAFLAFLAALGQLETGHVAAASLLMGGMAALAFPASTALVPEIASSNNLLSANALISMSAHLTGVIGPGLGALLVQQAGFPAALSLDALSFFISAAALGILLPCLPAAHPEPAKKINFLADFSTGWQVVLGQTWLWASMLILLLVNFTGRSTMNVALPFLVERKLGGSVDALGWMWSAFGLGSIVGLIWVGKRDNMGRQGWYLFGSLLAAGVLTALLGLPVRIEMLIVDMFMMGACLAVHNLVWTVALQDRIPRAVLSRVVSLNNISSTALLPLGFILVGWAADNLDVSLVFVIGGVLTSLLALLGLLFPVTRKLKEIR